MPLVAGPLVPDGAPGSVMIAGRPLCSMDGFELDLPATPENLAVFSCTGVSKDTRWEADATDAGEQSLVARLVGQRPELFAGRVFLMDRNSSGTPSTPVGRPSHLLIPNHHA